MIVADGEFFAILKVQVQVWHEVNVSSTRRIGLSCKLVLILWVMNSKLEIMLNPFEMIFCTHEIIQDITLCPWNHVVPSQYSIVSSREKKCIDREKPIILRERNELFRWHVGVLFRLNGIYFFETIPFSQYKIVLLMQIYVIQRWSIEI